jgi:hypothetical protein
MLVDIMPVVSLVDALLMQELRLKVPAPVAVQLSQDSEAAEVGH